MLIRELPNLEDISSEDEFTVHVQECILEFLFYETHFYPRFHLRILGNQNIPENLLGILQADEIEYSFHGYADIGTNRSIQDGLAYNFDINQEERPISQILSLRNVVI